MRFVIRIDGMVEAKDATEAAAIATKLDALLADPTLKSVLEMSGIKMVAHRVDRKPTPAPGGA